MKLAMEVAYPMVDLAISGRMWAVVRAKTTVGDFQVGDEVLAIVRCSGEDCVFAGLSRAPQKTDMWLGGTVIGFASPTEVLIIPEPFPLSMESSAKSKEIELEYGMTKLVTVIYHRKRDGRLEFVSWAFLGIEERPPVTWK